MAINLDALSHHELQALIKGAEAKMGAARKNHLQETRTKIDAILASAGLTLDEIYPKRGGKGAKGPKATVAPKYRNPDNATQTWSGRGKRPLWFVDALKKKGVTEENLLIPNQGEAKTMPVKKTAVKATQKAPSKKAAKK